MQTRFSCHEWNKKFSIQGSKKKKSSRKLNYKRQYNRNSAMIVFINISPPQTECGGSFGWRNWVRQHRIGWIFISNFQVPGSARMWSKSNLQNHWSGRLLFDCKLSLSRFKDLFFRGYLWKVSPLPSTALRYRSINFFIPRKNFHYTRRNKILFPFHEILCSRVLCFADGGQNDHPPPSRGKFNLLMTLAKTNQVQTKLRVP